MVITKSEFQQWKENEVTKAFFSAVNIRIAETTELLVLKAGIDPIEDNFLRGFIAAYNEALEFRVEELEDDN